MHAASRTLRIAALAFSGVLCLVSWARANHTVFSFQVDRFEGDGNLMGPHDGVFDVEDDFDDGLLYPQSQDSPWFPTYGTVFETGGFLFLTNPGVHWTATDPPLLDLSIAASTGPNYPTMLVDGEGDFTGIAYWEPLIPDVGHHYHFSVLTFGGSGGGDSFNEEAFGTGIRMKEEGLYIEQHLLEIDQTNLATRQLTLDHFAISAGDITGQIVFRIDFDDSTNLATSSFSLDGGTTWQSPFLPGEIFVGRTDAKFILSADPEAAATTTTITTTPSTSTTTTTMPAPGQQLTYGKLLLVKNPRLTVPRNRKVIYRGGCGYQYRCKYSMNTLVGDPTVNGATLKIKLMNSDDTEHATECYSMPASGWAATNKGFKYRDRNGEFGPVRKARIFGTNRPLKISVIAIAWHAPIELVPSTEYLRSVTNFRVGGGDQYCTDWYYSSCLVSRRSYCTIHTEKIFKAGWRTWRSPSWEYPPTCHVSACSPSGAFLDMAAAVLD